MTWVLAGALLAVLYFLGIGFGAFFIDPALLVIGGYNFTYFFYKFGVKLVAFLFSGMRKHLVLFFSLAAILRLESLIISSVRRFFVLLFLLTLAVLWIGGALPYLEFIRPSDLRIYQWFGIPDSFVSPSDNGNDFMWNGMGAHWVFGRIVPPELLPTYKYGLFNLWAVIMWISYFPILGLAVLEGQTDALIQKPRRSRLLRKELLIIAIGIFLSLSTVAFTALLVRLY